MSFKSTKFLLSNFNLIKSQVRKCSLVSNVEKKLHLDLKRSFNDEELKVLNKIKNLEDFFQNDKIIYDKSLDIDLDPFSNIIDKDYLQTLKPVCNSSFNIATFADKLEIIKEFVKLNVKIYEIEKNRDAANYLLNLDFDRECRPYLNFLHEEGLNGTDFGDFITKNIFFFKENLQNIKTRFLYLKKMKFKKKEIVQILIKYPEFINKSIYYLDAKLGYIQKYFNLKANDLRKIIVKCPELISYDKVILSVSELNLTEQLGFEKNEVVKIILQEPSIIIKKPQKIADTFEYIYKNITTKNELFCKFPKVLFLEIKDIRERHLYLKKIGRAQYDYNKPLYIPLQAFYIDEDIFLSKYCKTDIKDYNKFLKRI